MFKILRAIVTSSALTPRFKISFLCRSPIPYAVRAKGGASKNSSCSNGKAKSNSKPEPSCKRTARKKNCTKRQAPSPSYSECRREPTVPKPPSECDCGDFDKC